MIFLISISYDLYILKIIQGDTSTISLKEEYLVSFAFWLGLYTFFCLIPYLIDVIHLLNPKTIIEYLVHEIRKDNITNDIDNPFQPIFDLIQVSINRYDLMTARSGLDEVYKKVIKICESLNIQYDESGGTGEINDITIIYVKHLLRCGSLAIRIGDVELATEVSSNIDKFGIYLADKRLDDSPPHLVEEPKLVVAALTDFALESINAGLDQVTDSILASISAIMVHGFDNDNKNLFIQGILVFEKIGKNAAKHEKRDILQGIITYIAKLGFESKMSEFNDGTSQALVGLLSLGVIASEYNLRDCHILAANEFRRLAAILDILIVLPLLMHSQDDFKDNPHFISFIKTFDPSLNIPITIEDLEKAYKKKSSSE